jgi:glycosyltransferase involved in cell wall biosynthesis
LPWDRGRRGASVAKRALRVTTVAAAAQLGGTERVLLDFAARAFEYEIALRVLTPRDGPLVAILNEIGVPTEVVPASAAMLAGSQRAGRLWSAPAALAGLAAWARRLGRHRHMRDAEALYSVGFKPHLALALLRRHPVVWHLHEYPPATTGAAWRTISRHGPDAMIANSEATANAWRGRKGSVTVIPNGVDLDRFHPRPRTYWIHDRLGLPHTDRLIGMPAVFARWKGQMEVISAFSVIGARFSDVHLVFVGGSIYDTVAEREYATELEAAVRAANAGIHVLPFQPKIELTYPELDLVLHYSLRPEPFGRVILEAMASGVPVIAAGEGGPVEILGKREARSGKCDTGWLVAPRHPEALAATIEEALRLPAEDLDAMGAAARGRAEDQFSARQFARAVAEVIRNAALGQ